MTFIADKELKNAGGFFDPNMPLGGFVQSVLQGRNVKS